MCSEVHKTSYPGSLGTQAITWAMQKGTTITFWKQSVVPISMLHCGHAMHLEIFSQEFSPATILYTFDVFHCL